MRRLSLIALPVVLAAAAAALAADKPAEKAKPADDEQF